MSSKKLDQKYLLWKGSDYYYSIAFDKKRFSGFSLLEQVFDNREFDQSSQQMIILEKNVKFKASECEHGFVFEFDPETENTIAYDIMMKLSDHLSNRWIKSALYFKERQSNVGHLIY
jgi:hypothetical protein